MHKEVKVTTANEAPELLHASLCTPQTHRDTITIHQYASLREVLTQKTLYARQRPACIDHRLPT